MKVCKLCGSTYGDRVDFCFKDGQPLVTAEEPAVEDAPEAGMGRPGPGDMLDVPEPAFMRRGADPTGLPETGPADAGLSDPTALPDPTGLPADPTGLPAAGLSEQGLSDPTALPEPPAADASALPGLGQDEALPGPAPLEPPEPAVPVDPAAPDSFSTVGELEDPGAVDVPDPSDPFPEHLDSTAAAIGDSPVPPRSLFGADDLPGPTSLDEDLDDDAMADLARTLGGPAADRSDVAPEDQPTVDDSGASPALADLVEAPGEKPEVVGEGEVVIGVDHHDKDISFVDDAPPKKTDNKLVIALFAAAVLVALLAGMWIVGSGGKADDDPLANKPDERAAPVMAAPGSADPSPPQPAVEEAVVEDPAAQEAAVDAEQPGTEEAVAEQPAADEPAAEAPAAPAAAAPAAAEPVAQPAPREEPAAAPSTARTEQPVSTPPAAAEPTADLAAGTDPWQTDSATGRLTINTIPSGATVYVDNRQYGPSPLSAELGYGVHSIRVELGGYSSQSRTIDVQVPEMAVPFELKPLVVTGTVNVFGPTGASVYVDGAQVGKIPTSVKLTEGAHSFRVETADGTNFTHSQDVRFDGGDTVSVTLSP